ncbi:hypothetical protein [Corynebacterium sp. A21]|uniref:hypothetical protein n=1 Tax=Corynebacterium sp. A21 TaxID=3457318 RepID=UPI003FD0A78B
MSILPRPDGPQGSQNPTSNRENSPGSEFTGLGQSADFPSVGATFAAKEGVHPSENYGQVAEAPTSAQTPDMPASAGLKPRNLVLLIAKYVLACISLGLGVLLVFSGCDSNFTATKSGRLTAILFGLVFAVPAVWFLVCEVIDKYKIPKTGRRLKRFSWISVLASVVFLGTFFLTPEEGSGSHLASTGAFQAVLAAHTEAQENCFDLVLSHAKYPASAQVAESESAISVATSGQLVVHSFAGIAYFPNQFGVLSEMEFLCERKQDARGVVGTAAEAELTYQSVDVEEVEYFATAPDTRPTEISETVDTDDILGFDNAETQPQSVYVFIENTEESES